MQQIYQDQGEGGGLQGLLSGWEPTLRLGLEAVEVPPIRLGYLWYGITVYPGYEFFKRLHPGLTSTYIGPSEK